MQITVQEKNVVTMHNFGRWKVLIFCKIQSIVAWGSLGLTLLKLLIFANTLNQVKRNSQNQEL